MTGVGQIWSWTCLPLLLAMTSHRLLQSIWRVNSRDLLEVRGGTWIKPQSPEGRWEATGEGVEPVDGGHCRSRQDCLPAFAQIPTRHRGLVTLHLIMNVPAWGQAGSEPEPEPEPEPEAGTGTQHAHMVRYRR